MNADLGQTKFSEEEVSRLRTEVKRLRDGEMLSWNDINRESEIPAATMSSWMNDKYTGNNQNVTARVKLWLDAREEQAELHSVMPAAQNYQPTTTSAQIINRLRFAHTLEDFALIAGGPGIGKTSAIKQYQATRPRVTVVTMAPSSKAVNNMLARVLTVMGDTTATGVAYHLAHKVRAKIGDGRGSMLIFDDAQNLSDLAVEEIRTIHDETGIAIALVGNQEVFARLDGAGRTAAFAQITSRIGTRFNQNRPHDEDVEVLAASWGIDDAVSLVFLKKIAAKPGALRGVTKTVRLGTMLAHGENNPLAFSHLKSAWRQLGQDIRPVV